MSASERRSLARLVDRLWPSFDLYGPRPDPTPAEGPDPYGDADPAWLRIDWREHLARIDVGGATVNFVELGPPEPEQDPRAIVFVHGLSGCWQNWLENLPGLASTHRVIALDLPGFGASPLPSWEISIPAYGRLLRDFCLALGVRDCVVVGSSMGGFVAAEAVIAEQERFEKLVLVSAAGISSNRLRERPTEVAARSIAAAAPYTFELQTRAFRRPRARAMAFRNVFRHPELLRPELLWEFFAGGLTGTGFAAALTAVVRHDFLDRLEDVVAPTLIAWGRNDMIVPPADALEYGRRLVNSQTVIFDDTGHVPMAERPVRFNRLLDAFVAAP